MEERDEAAHMLKLFLLGGATFVTFLCSMVTYGSITRKDQENKCVSELANSNRTVAEIKELCK